jgi:zinc protease
MAAAAVLTLAGCAHLPPPGLHMSDAKFPIREITLPSGMRILIEEDHRSPVVGVVSVVGAGSANDPKGREGLAHFIEHLTFRARPDGKTGLWNMLEYSGTGALNAFTGLDTTTFYEFGPKESLESLLTIEASRLSNPITNLDDDTFNVEREVVRNELRERNETGYPSQVLSWVQSALFPEGHPYARPGIGTHESLSAITRSDVSGFVAENYRPQNMTLLVAGDFDPAQLQQMLSRVLPAELSRPGVRPKRSAQPEEPPAVPEHGLYQFTANVPGPMLYLAWSLPSGVGDLAAIEQFLNHSFDSEVVNAFSRDEDIESISGDLLPADHASILLCAVKLRVGDHPEKTVEHIEDQVFKLWGEHNAFYRLRTQLVTEVASEAESLEQRSLMRAESTHFTGDPATFNRELKGLATMTEDAVQRFAFKYLSRDRARVLFVTPAPGASQAKASVVSTFAPKDSIHVAYPTSAIQQIIHPAGASSLKTITLDNGLEVIIGVRKGWPQATVEMAFAGGSADATPPGVGFYARLAWPKSHYHGDISEYGALEGRRMREDATFLIQRGGNGNVANLLAMVSDEVGSMQLPGYAIDEIKPRLIPILAAAEKEPALQREWHVDAALFGEGPYGQHVSAAQLEPIGSSAVSDYLDRIYDPKNARLAVVGDFDPAEVEQEVRDWFSNWKSNGPGLADPKVTLPPAANAPKVMVDAVSGATQEQIELGCVTEVSSLEDQVADELLAELLADELYSSARMTIGATYGFSGGSTVLRGHVAKLTVEGDVDNAHFARVLASIRTDFAHLHLRTFTEQQLNRAKWSLAKRYDLRFLTDESIARAALVARLHGQPVSTLDDYPKALLAVTPEKLAEAAKACHAHSVVSVLGDKAVAVNALSAIPLE